MKMKPIRHNSSPFMSIVLEEISLEGLAGITLETLWRRLSVNAHWSWSCTIDEDTKETVWNYLIKLNAVRWFLLPNVRNTPRIYNSVQEYLNHTLHENISSSEIYKYSEVKNEEDMGSCIDYATRKDISKKIINETLSNAIKTFGDRLIIVANQYHRSYYLFSDKRFKWKDLDIATYCILERIGRSRKLGTLISEFEQPTLLDEMVKQKLIKKQMVHAKREDLLVFVLERFHKQFLQELISYTTEVIREMIDSSPHGFCLLDELKSSFSETEITSTLHSPQYSRYFSISEIQVIELFQMFGGNYVHASGMGGREFVKIVKNSMLTEENNLFDEESIEKILQKIDSLNEECSFNTIFLKVCYGMIHKAGFEGITRAEINRVMGINQSISINLINTLLSMKLIVDIKGNGSYKYFAQHYINHGRGTCKSNEFINMLENGSENKNAGIKRKLLIGENETDFDSKKAKTSDRQEVKIIINSGQINTLKLNVLSNGFIIKYQNEILENIYPNLSELDIRNVIENIMIIWNSSCGKNNSKSLFAVILKLFSDGSYKSVYIMHKKIPKIKNQQINVICVHSTLKSDETLKEKTNHTKSPGRPIVYFNAQVIPKTEFEKHTLTENTLTVTSAKRKRSNLDAPDNIQKIYKLEKCSESAVKISSAKKEILIEKNKTRRLDSFDVEAKKKPNRCSWSKEEDDLIVKCIIAKFFCTQYYPFYKSGKIIKQLLHESCVKSCNKTSDACTKHILHILNKKASVQDIQMRVYELKLDSAMQKQLHPLVEKIDENNSAKLKQEMCDEMMKIIFQDLCRKTRSNGSPQFSDAIPKDVETFRKIYHIRSDNDEQLQKLLPLNCERDIRAMINMDLILSCILSRYTEKQMNQVFHDLDCEEKEAANIALNFCEQHNLINTCRNEDSYKGVYMPLRNHYIKSKCRMKCILNEKLYTNELYKRYLRIIHCKKNLSRDVWKDSLGILLLANFFINNNIEVKAIIPDEILLLTDSDSTFQTTSKSDCKDKFSNISVSLIDNVNKKTDNVCCFNSKHSIDIVNFSIDVQLKSWNSMHFVPWNTSNFESDLISLNMTDVIYEKFSYTNDEIQSRLKSSLVPEASNVHLNFAVDDLLNYLKKHGVFGVTSLELMEKYQKYQPQLTTTIRKLCLAKLILRSGSHKTCYIHIEFAKSWLFPLENCQQNQETSFKTNRFDFEKLQYFITYFSNFHRLWINTKPWIHYNGLLNFKVWVNFSRQLLDYLLRYPGISLADIQERFTPEIRPHLIREIIEVLVEIGCVKWFKFRRPRMDLFSTNSYIDQMVVPDDQFFCELEKECNVILEPSVDSLLKFSAFVSMKE